MSTLYLTTLWTTAEHNLTMSFHITAMTWVSIEQISKYMCVLTLSTHIRWTFSSSVPFSLVMYSLRKWLDLPHFYLIHNICIYPKESITPACSQKYALLLYPAFRSCPVLCFPHFPTLNLMHIHSHSNIPPSPVAPKMANVRKTGKMILNVTWNRGSPAVLFLRFYSGLWADCNLY